MKNKTKKQPSDYNIQFEHGNISNMINQEHGHLCLQENYSNKQISPSKVLCSSSMISKNDYQQDVYHGKHFVV